MMKLLAVLATVSEVDASLNLSSGVSGTVYVIRHGEFGSDGCTSSSSKGWKRAESLPEVFKNKFSMPEYVYAWQYEPNTCQRCNETATPIANKVGMSKPDINHGYMDCTSKHCMDVANAIKSRLASSNPVLVVSEHIHIQFIIESLGMNANDIPYWPGNVFDWVYTLEFSEGNLVSFTKSDEGPTPAPSPSPTRRRSSPTPIPSPTPAQSDTLLAGKRIESGESLISSTGNAHLEMQNGDGNLVLYSGSNSEVVWASGTSGNPGSHLSLQGSDGNLVLRSSSGQSLWSSSTHSGASKAVLYDDCRFEVSDSSDKVLWSLGTSCSPELASVSIV